MKLVDLIHVIIILGMFGSVAWALHERNETIKCVLQYGIERCK